jgi:cysteine desulfurase/selenocysteine lyase
MGLGAAIEYLAGIGRDKIESHVMAMRARLVDELKTVKGEIISPPAGKLASSIVTLVPPKGLSIDNLATALREKHRVIVGAKDRVNGIRISLHLYNGQRDVDAVIAGLRAELG